MSAEEASSAGGLASHQAATTLARTNPPETLLTSHLTCHLPSTGPHYHQGHPAHFPSRPHTQGWLNPCPSNVGKTMERVVIVGHMEVVDKMDKMARAGMGLGRVIAPSCNLVKVQERESTQTIQNFRQRVQRKERFQTRLIAWQLKQKCLWQVPTRSGTAWSRLKRVFCQK